MATNGELYAELLDCNDRVWAAREAGEDQAVQLVGVALWHLMDCCDFNAAKPGPTGAGGSLRWRGYVRQARTRASAITSGGTVLLGIGFHVGSDTHSVLGEGAEVTLPDGTVFVLTSAAPPVEVGKDRLTSPWWSDWQSLRGARRR